MSAQRVVIEVPPGVETDTGWGIGLLHFGSDVQTVTQAPGGELVLPVGVAWHVWTTYEAGEWPL